MANASYHNVSLTPFHVQTEFCVKCWVNRVFVGYAQNADAARALTASIIAAVEAAMTEQPHTPIDWLIAEVAQDLAEQAEDSDERYAADLADAEHARGFDAGIVHRGDAVRR